MSLTTVYIILILLYLLVIAKAGNSFPILYLFAFTYFLQYIFSPFLGYNEYQSHANQMVISQETYFDFAIPAILSLFAGVFIWNRRKFRVADHLARINPDEAYRLGYFLFVTSYLFDVFPYLGINFFSSIVSFTTYLKFVAAFCFLFGEKRLGYFFIAVVYGQLVIQALASGVFISLFIWTTFLFFFVSLKFKLSFFFRLSFLVMALPVLMVVQSVKHEYRRQVWEGKREGGVELLTELVEKNESKAPEDESLTESKGFVKTIGRLNQGWHLGMTLNHVPRREPFAEGSEMFSDIVSSILPRIVFSDKKVVNSQDKFEKYTGHELLGTTSMSIGVLGDFYINFGFTGSFIALFIFGFIITRLYHFFVNRYVIRDPINIIWIPFILSYLIRANNDFYIFFNGMVKGFIIFLLVTYIRNRYFQPKRRMVPAPVPKASLSP